MFVSLARLEFITQINGGGGGGIVKIFTKCWSNLAG